MPLCPAPAQGRQRGAGFFPGGAHTKQSHLAFAGAAQADAVYSFNAAIDAATSTGSVSIGSGATLTGTFSIGAGNAIDAFTFTLNNASFTTGVASTISGTTIPASNDGSVGGVRYSGPIPDPTTVPWFVEMAFNGVGPDSAGDAVSVNTSGDNFIAVLSLGSGNLRFSSVSVTPSGGSSSGGSSSGGSSSGGSSSSGRGGPGVPAPAAAGLLGLGLLGLASRKRTASR